MNQRTLLLGLAAFALGCSAPPDESPKELIKVRMSFGKHLSYGPLMVAQAEGFFRDEGIDLEWVPLVKSAETLVALITGDIDVRPGPIHAGFLSAIGRQAPIRIVAGMGNLNAGSCTYYGIILRPGLDTAGTPKIKRMRASSDGATRFVVKHMLAKRNIGINSLEAVSIPEAVMATALETGALDAIAVSEPALTRLRNKGTFWLSGQDAVPGFQWGVIAFGERLLTRDREIGTRFLRAYQRGVAQYLQGKTDRNVAIIAEATNETVETTRAVCWPDFAPDSRINWESLAAYQDWAVTEGLMLKAVSRAQATDSLFVTAPGMP